MNCSIVVVCVFAVEIALDRISIVPVCVCLSFECVFLAILFYYYVFMYDVVSYYASCRIDQFG